MIIGITPKNAIKIIGVCFGTMTGLKLIHHKVLLASSEGPVDVLLSVHMMTRHGARTPMILVHNLEEVFAWIKFILK